MADMAIHKIEISDARVVRLIGCTTWPCCDCEKPLRLGDKACMVPRDALTTSNTVEEVLLVKHFSACTT